MARQCCQERKERGTNKCCAHHRDRAPDFAPLFFRLCLPYNWHYMERYTTSHRGPTKMFQIVYTLHALRLIRNVYTDKCLIESDAPFHLFIDLNWIFYLRFAEWRRPPINDDAIQTGVEQRTSLAVIFIPCGRRCVFNERWLAKEKRRASSSGTDANFVLSWRMTGQSERCARKTGRSSRLHRTNKGGYMLCRSFSYLLVSFKTCIDFKWKFV